MMKACTCEPRARAAPPQTSEMVILDENFECMQRMAEAMCKTLARPKDREICMETLGILEKYQKANNVEIKRNINTFMRFYMKVLRWTQIHQPLALYQQWYGEAACRGATVPCALSASGVGMSQGSEAALGEMRVWLESQRSYLAMKTYEDGSTIIYAAVARRAAPGWIEGGLKHLQTNPECIECAAGTCT